MEVVGLTVSIASLVTLFQTAVDCFEYVELGKNFGVDYQMSRLKLDSAHLRLTRWGESVGLGGNTEAAKSLQNVSVPQKDIKHAEELLGHIINLFQKAEERAKTLGPPAGAGTASSADDGDLSSAGRSLRQRMLEICRRRHKKTSAGKKARWAIYQRAHFNEVISDINDLLNGLLQQFPATKPVQQSICEQEAAELMHEEALPQLQEAARADDQLLEQAIQNLQKGRAQKVSYTWNNSDSTKVVNQVSGDQTFNGGQTFSF